MKTQTFVTLALSGLAAAQSRPNLTAAIASENDTLSALAGLIPSDLLGDLNRLRNVTILAPSNDALEELLKDKSIASMVSDNSSFVTDLLQYHILNGTYYASNITEMDMAAFVPTLLTNSTYSNVTGGQRVEVMAENDTVSFYSGFRAQSNVTKADLNFTGGVIHIINRVLTIPKNISDTAIAANLSAAAGALTESKLLPNLTSARNITVFVPSNGAFANIGSILANASESDLQDILKYHVVNNTLGYSSTLENGTLTTSDGEDLNIAIYNGTVYVNEAKVIVPDVLISNGVLHVIDGVLNPDKPSATANPTASTQEAAFSGASSVSDIPFTSGIPAGTEAGATGLSPETSTEGAAQATAAIALGALFGGAALVMNV
ncbi:FAS1 domain-containing protein [Fusarium flagelliforme]|uniref:FAS1 domain-containing protein n=1 Tax=Fusarium flagelliforme TaxID=2675880 RepID=UPI001E8D666F|nr:FAS1 domain-containing protein [Fusarium flagelliforme]KAH7198433.1 FAS1 domain-containing protein [Fusarium flagelliforme]